jgi:hypothetical protein
MIDVTAHRPGFDIGHVARASFDILRRRPVSLASLGLLFCGLPLLLEQWVRHLLLLSGAGAVSWMSFGLTTLFPFTGQALLIPAVATLPTTKNGAFLRALGVLMRSGWALIPYWAVNAIPSFFRIAQLARAPFDFGSPVWSAISYFDLCLNLALVFTVAVYAPVVVVERAGIARSLARTLQLMRAGRWQVLALFVMIGVASAGATLLVNFGLGSHSLDGTARNVRRAIECLDQLAWSVVLAASYKELVRTRDGPPRDQVAEVFA